MTEEKKKSGRPISSPAPWGELYMKVGQEKIAKDLGVAKSTVHKWARNVHRIPKSPRGMSSYVFAKSMRLKKE